MSESEAFRRGDVILVSFPVVSDPRRRKTWPAVVIQNDVGNRFSANLIVAGISSQLPARPYPTSRIVCHGSVEAEGSGLARDSVVQAEVIVTLPKTAVVGQLGRFNRRAREQIDQCLSVSLGRPGSVGAPRLTIPGPGQEG